MLPRTSRPSLAAAKAAPWPAGSAKALGLVRDHDSGSTATVARSDPRTSRGDDDDDDQLAATGRRSDPPPPLEDDDSLETVHRGQKRLPAAAFDDSDAATPVGLKQIKTPPEMAVQSAPISGPPAPLDGGPDSGCTRVAPIAAPVPTTQHQHQLSPQALSMMQQQQRSALTGPMHNLLQAGTAKALALPPHRIALLISSILLFSAVLFLVMRRAPAHVEATNAFPPAPTVIPITPVTPSTPVTPVEVAPPVLPAPVNGLIAPPGAPAPIVPAPAAQPRAERAASAPRRPRTARPSIPVSIPVHRE